MFYKLVRVQDRQEKLTEDTRVDPRRNSVIIPRHRDTLGKKVCTKWHESIYCR